MAYGRSYKEIQRERVRFTKCGKYLARGSLAAHFPTHNGVAKGVSGQEGCVEVTDNEPRMYRMVFLANSWPRTCPVEGCSVQADMQTFMQVHFWHRHVQGTLIILG